MVQFAVYAVVQLSIIELLDFQLLIQFMKRLLFKISKESVSFQEDKLDPGEFY